MQRNMRVLQSKPNQFTMGLPVEWIRATGLHKKDLLMVFSPDSLKSPLIVVPQLEYVENPKIRKLVDEVLEVIVKNEGEI